MWTEKKITDIKREEAERATLQLKELMITVWLAF